MTKNLLGMDRAELQAAAGEGEPNFRGRQLFDALYRQRVTELDEITTIPKALRIRLSREYALAWPEIAQSFDSSDGTRRYLLKLSDGKTVESVWMPEAGRSTICISTQVGCPVNCRFCLTALLGLERNLTAGEIVGQVLRAAADRDVEAQADRLNIVMMGQGEPLLNLPNVLQATRLLTDPDGMAISARRITVSTAGIVPKIAELGQAEIRPKLAISLNASTEEQRRELMPITRKYHLRDLMEACRAYPLRSWEKLTFEYVLLKNVNDSDADAKRVVKLLANLNAKVNLIALNPGPDIPYETPSAERVESFQSIVRRSLPCFVRKPRGLDVYAACGQLKRMDLAQIAELTDGAPLGDADKLRPGRQAGRFWSGLAGSRTN
ncbi:MAG TPA: 23S rRNA (adenine(2503)-C(2))-methyltransferase RlmN [Bryobacteraceae bacterium]|jgi:23S rRNA (adenine2503-C2)-methyltransferase